MRKILIVGGGGREHAIARYVASPDIQLYCAPGNGGIAQLAECVPIKATDLDGMVAFARDNAIDTVIVAPDDPLALGMVDALQAAGIRAFGPTKAAAEIESSKVFSKGFMQRHNIPTAAYASFDDFDAAVAYARQRNEPLYIKADGLSLGKGAVYAADVDAAERILRGMMLDGVHGDAGRSVVIESMLYGVEATVLAFIDGETVVPMPASRDHKKAFDGDKGLNTGGMGAIAPHPQYTPAMAQYCMERIFAPTVRGMMQEGRSFHGILYFGLMLHPDTNTASVIEYNARFGDPEAQVVLPLLRTPLMQVFDAIIDRKLHTLDVQWSNQAAAVVVLASGGYPESYQSGYAIAGLDALRQTYAYHAGTQCADGGYVTAGGRVVGIGATGASLSEALAVCYDEIRGVSFTDMQYRTDIGR